MAVCTLFFIEGDPSANWCLSSYSALSMKVAETLLRMYSRHGWRSWIKDEQGVIVNSSPADAAFRKEKMGLVGIKHGFINPYEHCSLSFAKSVIDPEKLESIVKRNSEFSLDYSQSVFVQDWLVIPVKGRDLDSLGYLQEISCRPLTFLTA